MNNLLPALLVGSLLALSPATAQTTQPEGDPRLERALGAIGDGNLPQAVQLLEEIKSTTSLDPPAQALLGALYAETGRFEEAVVLLQPMAEREDADPAVLYNAGRAMLGAGRPGGEAYLQRSVALQPGSPAARALGMLKAQRGDYFEGYLHLKAWVQGNPDDTEARLAAALSAVQLKRPTEAEALLSDLPQDNPRVRLLWGKLLLDKADPYGALATLQPLLESAPASMNLDVRRSLAQAHAAVGEAAEAVGVLTGYVNGNPAVALQLGQAQYQSGDLEGALATIGPFAEKALAGAGQGPEPAPGIELSLIVEHGRLLVTGGRHAEALPYLELATRIDPDNKQSWHQLGQALAAAGRREEARVALERFQDIVKNEVPASMNDVQLEKDLEDPTGRELREAVTALAKGDVNKALIIVRREQALSPEDIRPWLLEGRILLQTGQMTEALELADQIVEGAPESADAVYLRATALMAASEFAAAERDFGKALELSPQHSAALNDFAVLLMHLGKNGEAADLLERALALQPDDEMAAANLEKLRQP